MGQTDLKDALREIGFSSARKTNTRDIYTYQGMRIGIIYAAGKYGVSVAINNQEETKYYSNSEGVYVNDWAFEMAQNYVASHS